MEQRTLGALAVFQVKAPVIRTADLVEITGDLHIRLLVVVPHHNHEFAAPVSVTDQLANQLGRRLAFFQFFTFQPHVVSPLCLAQSLRTN